MGHLRDKMERDLKIANYSPSTIKIYLLYAKLYAKHYMRSPEEMGEEEIRNFLLHLYEERNVSYSTYRQAHSALKFLYKVTLHRPFEVERLQFPRAEKKLPVVLSGSEVERLFKAMDHLKYRTIVITLYATGMRIGETCRLRVGDIDPERMVIRVSQGKNRKDRYVRLSEKLLKDLRDYWRSERPEDYLFPGEISAKHVRQDSVRLYLMRTALNAGLNKDVKPHMLRHTYATHMLELGEDIAVVQKLLGHSNIFTTAIYLHVSTGLIRRAKSPFDLLGTPEGEPLG